MRRPELARLDPEIEAELDAIDAVLAGDPVDAAHAELAEMVLLVAAERPRLSGEFAGALDQRVAQRFVSPAPFSSLSTPGSGPHSDRLVQPVARRRRLRPAWAPFGAMGLAAAATTAVVVVAGSIGGGGRGIGSSPGTPVGAGATKPTGSVAPGSSSAPFAVRSPAPATQQGSSAPSGQALSLPANGRKVVQSAQLDLTAAPDRMDSVAQEIYNVVGRVNGFVEHSSVTSGGGGAAGAQFQLSVPSPSLPQAMASLSRLPGASVASRTDQAQDVNGQYGADVRALADARALRTTLLRQLAGAVSQAQIDSLNAQIHGAEASISSDLATLQALSHQVAFSQIQLNVQSAPPGPVPAPDSGGFTIGRGLHDAGRVLTVAAGVGLIVLAALVPMALVGAIALWLSGGMRRRSRERALDAG